MASESALIFLVLQLFIYIIEGREFCDSGDSGEDYWCNVGHCCGNGDCCTYYYELWWFWLVWFMIVFAIGVCVWQRKRLHPWRDQPYNRNHCGLCGPPDLYPDILPIPPVKLPTYAEIGETASFSTPPPPYTCECYMPGGLTTTALGSFDQPPPDAGAPPCYMQYAHIIAPLMPRRQPNTSTGTQFPEGSPTINVSTDDTHSVTDTVDSSSPVSTTPSVQQTPESPCLSCSSSSSPLTGGRSCSCSSVQSVLSVPARNEPGHAVSGRLVSDVYLKPSWLSQPNFGKVHTVGTFQFGGRLQVPYGGANFNPCPRCVSRSVSSLRHCSSSSAIMRDASTSTLPQVEAQPTQAANQNQEPERYERRNSYSLPRNFVCSTKPKK